MCVLCFSDNLIADITNKLQDVRNPLAAMNALLRELDLEAELDTPDTTLSRTGGISHTYTRTLSSLRGSQAESRNKYVSVKILNFDTSEKVLFLSSQSISTVTKGQN